MYYFVIRFVVFSDSIAEIFFLPFTKSKMSLINTNITQILKYVLNKKSTPLSKMHHAISIYESKLSYINYEKITHFLFKNISKIEETKNMRWWLLRNKILYNLRNVNNSPDDICSKNLRLFISNLLLFLYWIIKRNFLLISIKDETSCIFHT